MLGLQAKLIIGLVILAILGGMGFVIRYQYTTNQTLKDTNSKLVETNKNLQETIDNNEKFAKVNEDTNTKTDTEVKKVEEDSNTNIADMNKKVNAIEKKYAIINTSNNANISLPCKVVQDTLAKQSTESSIVIIDTLWNEYCTNSGIDCKNIEKIKDNETGDKT